MKSKCFSLVSMPCCFLVSILLPAHAQETGFVRYYEESADNSAVTLASDSTTVQLAR